MDKSARFGKGAIGKVNQALPTTDANITSVSNRVAELEAQNLESRIAALETLLASHTHSYDDDNGTTTTTKTTSTHT